MVANAKHQQQTMEMIYGFFSSFKNISNRNREEYDLKKHQGQHIWKGNRLRLIIGQNNPRNTHVSRDDAITDRLTGVLDETRTARTRVWTSCAHASWCKFASGSRGSLFRPRILRSLYSLPLRPEYLFTKHHSVTQNLSDMWRSTFEIDAVPQPRFVTEIAPKSLFSCLNRSPIRSGMVLRVWTTAIR